MTHSGALGLVNFIIIMFFFFKRFGLVERVQLEGFFVTKELMCRCLMTLRRSHDRTLIVTK